MDWKKWFLPKNCDFFQENLQLPQLQQYFSNNQRYITAKWKSSSPSISYWLFIPELRKCYKKVNIIKTWKSKCPITGNNCSQLSFKLSLISVLLPKQRYVKLVVSYIYFSDFCCFNQVISLALYEIISDVLNYDSLMINVSWMYLMC